MFLLFCFYLKVVGKSLLFIAPNDDDNTLFECFDLPLTLQGFDKCCFWKDIQKETVKENTKNTL